MPAPFVATYADAIDHLVGFVGGSAQAAAQQELRGAVLEAYTKISHAHNWTYLYTPYQIRFNEPYATGTVSYDHCVTPEHEALTRTGWKRHSQLKVGDEILGYNHETETCSWQPIEAIHTFQYSGKILEVQRKGRAVLRCTPNHRIPVVVRGRRGRLRRKEYVLAKDLNSEHCVPLAAPLETESDGHLNARHAALLSWLVTDGCGLFNRKYHNATIVQSFSANPHKCDEIAQLVGREGRPYGDGMMRFPVLPGDRNLLRSHVEDKKDVVRAVCEMGVQEAEAAVRAMSLAESSTNSNGQNVFSQWGDNQPIAEAFQIACLLTGRAANISCREFDGKIRYQVPVRHSRCLKPARCSKWVDYQGLVWCPQVATTAWVTRCNGAVMVTGNSGGLYERLVTLASGTWPAWTLYGHLKIGSQFYFVEDRKSDTVLTLDAKSNPGEDVAAGTSYTLYRSVYPAPGDFKSMGEPQGQQTSGPCYVPVEEWNRRERHTPASSSQQSIFTIMADNNLVGSFGLYVYPYPSAAQILSFIYQRLPRPLRYSGYETNSRSGTVTGVAASQTISGSGTAFTAAMRGSFIRFSSDTTQRPTGLAGLNPWAEQKVIVDVTSATACVIDSPLVNAYTNTKYTVSDPLDLDPSMWSAFLRACEWSASVIRPNPNREVDTAYRMYLDAQIAAREADRKFWGERSPGYSGSVYDRYLPGPYATSP